MTLKQALAQKINTILSNEFGIDPQKLEIQRTRAEFEGDLTLVVFPLVKILKNKPEAIAQSIGQALINQRHCVRFNVVKGFLNLVLPEKNLVQQLSHLNPIVNTRSKQMVEYSSPNTNKPLHLGHIRNNLLGYSVARILEAAGHPTTKTQIINDRGIHICKSMWAWQEYGKGETPETSGLKGDHLVGKYYVKFNQVYEAQIDEMVASGMEKEEAKKQAPALLAAQEMLRKWEAGDSKVRKMWETLNQWVYEGFNISYSRLGVDFDNVQYESQTYLLGKELVQLGLEKEIFYTKPDGSVWCDLTDEGLDEKLLLRSDGTAVYMTQDIGTAVERFKNHDIEGLTYVVGNEQDYHFKVLFLILKKLGFPWTDKLNHLSYAMVDLPDGKMKSREGTVVDADELMDEMKSTAKTITEELGKLEDSTEEEKNQLYEAIGLGALKYYILKVDPKKRILFNPKESIDFQGDTGPFLQYTHARICSLLRKGGEPGNFQSVELVTEEKALILFLDEYQETIEKAARELNPALVTNYLFDLVKLYNRFYQHHKILHSDTPEAVKNFRLKLSQQVAFKLKSGLDLLGIAAPERM